MLTNNNSPPNVAFTNENELNFQKRNRDAFESEPDFENLGYKLSKMKLNRKELLQTPIKLTFGSISIIPDKKKDILAQSPSKFVFSKENCHDLDKTINNNLEEILRDLDNNDNDGLGIVQEKEENGNEEEPNEENLQVTFSFIYVLIKIV